MRDYDTAASMYRMARDDFKSDRCDASDGRQMFVDSGNGCYGLLIVFVTGTAPFGFLKG